MKILIDMQGLQTPFSAKRGVGTYIDGLVGELGGANNSHELHFLFNAEFPEEYFTCISKYDFMSENNTHVFTQGIIEKHYGADQNSLRMVENYFTAIVESLRPDIFFSPNLQEGLHDRAISAFAAEAQTFAQVSTLHDMVPMYFEDDYLADPGTRQWYRRKVGDAKKSDRILTVSNASKVDIARFLDVDSAKISVIPNGFDARRYNPDGSPGEHQAVRDMLGDSRDFVLYVGGGDKHKNLGRLVQAYGLLPRDLRRKYALVLGGGGLANSTELIRAVREQGLEDDVLFPGFIPDAMLPATIRQASLFAFPSLYEGFGLPPLEAMACGTPTIASSTAAVAEVMGKSPGIFDPNNPDEIAKVMGKALTQDEFRAALRTHGLSRAADFSWRKSAQELLGLFEEEHERLARRSRFTFLSRRMIRSVENAPGDLAYSAAVNISETAASSDDPTVYVDVSSVALYGGNSGIQRVAREVASHLSEALAPHFANAKIVYAIEGTTDFRALESFVRDESFEPDPDVDSAISFAPNDTLLFLDLHPGLAIRMEERTQRLRALGVRVYHVLYDILPVLMPDKFWPELQEEFYRWLQCVSRSDGLACISRTVSEETAEYLARYGVRRSGSLQIGHFLLGSDFEERQSQASPDEQLSEEFGAGKKFLMVGTLEPRKAHEQVIRAFEQAWADGESWRLIIVGKLGWNMDRLGEYLTSHPELNKRLFWFDRANDAQLKSIYGQAECVICASQGEGFGLPLVEAAHFGKPVIARDIAVFREVAGDDATYFANERSPSVITKAIKDWLHSDKQRGSRPTSARQVGWRESASTLAGLIFNGTWDHSIEPEGALDLANPITIPNPNVKTSGFYEPEGEFRWTAARAGLEFQLAEDFDKVSIELESFSWKRMPFRIFMDGQEVYSASAEKDGVVHKIPSQSLARGSHRIEIQSTAAGSPKGDNRALGIALKYLRIVAMRPIQIGDWVNVRDLNVAWTGFSDIEFAWRWTTAVNSTIEFDLPSSVKNGQISIYCRAADELDATFTVNGKKVGETRLSRSLQVVDLQVGHLERGRNVLGISIPDAQQFSSDDKRTLGMRMLEFKIADVADGEASSKVVSGRPKEGARTIAG